MDRRPAWNDEAPPRRTPENSLELVPVIVAELGDQYGFIGDLDAHGSSYLI
jgi:hypothetical protein